MADEEFAVVVNEEAQYSIWPRYEEVPEGWYEVGVEGSKETCLDYIEEVWTDIRPLSVRKAQGEDVDPPDVVKAARDDWDA